MTGPIDYVVLAFPGNQFNGSILPELDKVVANGSIKIVDLLFITKDEDGNVGSLELSQMPQEVVDHLGPASNGFEGLLSVEDVVEVGEQLDNNTSGAIFVFEHLWAVGLKEAVINSGGVLIADGRVHDEAVLAARDELLQLNYAQGE